MTTQNWSQILQNAKPQKGFAALDPGAYRFRILSGSGKTAGTGSEMIAVQMEVISAGPNAGRKVFHNFVLPTGQNDTDPDKVQTRIDRFLGDMEAFGLTKDWFVQLWAAQGPTKETCDYVGQALVNRTCKATASLQKDDKSRNNFNGFLVDDGVDPAPVAQVGPAVGGIAPPPAMPGISGPGAGMPGLPPVGGPPAPPAAPPAPPAAPAAPAMPAAPAGPSAPPAPPAPPAMPGMPAAPPVAPPAAPPIPGAAPGMPPMPGMPSAGF